MDAQGPMTLNLADFTDMMAGKIKQKFQGTGLDKPLLVILRKPEAPDSSVDEDFLRTAAAHSRQLAAQQERKAVEAENELSLLKERGINAIQQNKLQMQHLSKLEEARINDEITQIIEKRKIETQRATAAEEHNWERQANTNKQNHAKAMLETVFFNNSQLLAFYLQSETLAKNQNAVFVLPTDNTNILQIFARDKI